MEWILITIIVVLILVVGALSYACYNLLNKLEIYEAWTEKFQNEIDQVYTKLKQIDDRNLFEKDDDVGFVFSEIVRITKEFNDRIK